MTTRVETVSIDTLAEEASPEGRPPRLWRVLLSSGSGRVGIALGISVLFVIAFGRFLAPYDPNAIGVGTAMANPSGAHWLGTDELGRDTLSRLLVGGNTIILIPLAGVTISLLLGGGCGMLGGYIGGIGDAIITRVFDVLLTLPPLLIVLVLIGGLGTSNMVLVLMLLLVNAPRMGRLARGATQSVITNDYISAARARGEQAYAILVREVLPNVIAPLTADFVLRITYGVIFIATLNFLGLGIKPPTADWGAMVAEYRSFINIAPLGTLAPAAALALLSISLNLIAEALVKHVTREANEPVVL